jgi:hypothetical protein
MHAHPSALPVTQLPLEGELLRMLKYFSTVAFIQAGEAAAKQRRCVCVCVRAV